MTTPRELLADIRRRGIELELSPDGRRFRPLSPVDEETLELMRRERLWVLMVLHHEAGGDQYDPRLAFLASAEDGLTRGAIATRMSIAYGIEQDLALELIELAETAGFLVRSGELYHPRGRTAYTLLERGRQRELPA